MRNVSAGLLYYCTFESNAGYLILLTSGSTQISYATFKAKSTALITFGATALTSRSYTVEYFVPSDAASSYRGRYMTSTGTLTVFDVTL